MSKTKNKRIFFKGARDEDILIEVKRAISAGSNLEFEMINLYIQNYLVFSENLSPDEITYILKSAINVLKKKFLSKIDKITKGDIEKAINDAYTQHSNIQDNSFSILIPSKILHDPSNLDEVLIKNHVIKCISSNNVSTTFIFESFEEYISRNEIKPFFDGIQYSFFLISVAAKSKDEAADKAIKLFDLFRSIVNISYRYGSLTRQFGKLESLSLIRRPPFVMIFDKNNQCISEFINHFPIFNGVIQSEFDLKGKLISRRKMVDDIIAKLNTTATDLTDLICDLILLLTSALDDYYDPKLCSLNLWLIFEITSMKEERENHSIIPYRIASLFSNKNKIIEGILHNLRKARHSYIHQGKTDQFCTIHNDIYRVIVEDLILYLINHLSEIQTKENLKKKYPSDIANNSNSVIHSCIKKVSNYSSDLKNWFRS